MRPNRWGIAVVALAALVLSVASVPARDLQAYLKADAIDLVELLASPPPPDSRQTAVELEELLAVQTARTKDEVAHATADQEETLFRFLSGMGIEVDKDKLPLSAELFRRVGDTEHVVTYAAKHAFGRTRPFMVDERIEPVVRRSKSASYPSSHAAYGTVVGLVVARMLPEKRGQIGARIYDYARSRAIGGVHYRSDLIAGHIAGTLIADALFKTPEFLRDFEPAKAELRRALGL